MPIVIDGWNFIRNRSSDIDDDEMESLDSARLLIAYLGRFQETHNDPVVLVFDSTNEFLDVEYKNSPSLTVIPARNADDYIKRYIDTTPERQRRNIRVVSSDNEIYHYAKSAYATPINCEEFWVKLRKGLCLDKPVRR
ncbi:MAG: NYN domain-containing protein [Candidatus Omnitrophota bacterium]|nr:NYN domain-containing protein [Candidatus Omnitrophota bacterium]